MKLVKFYTVKAIMPFRKVNESMNTNIFNTICFVMYVINNSPLLPNHYYMRFHVTLCKRVLNDFLLPSPRFEIPISLFFE